MTLPPAPYLPDAGEAIRKAIEEGIKDGMALAKRDQEEAARAKRKKDSERVAKKDRDEEARAKIKVESERESSPGGPQAVAQDERDRSPERLFVAQGDDEDEGVARTSTIPSGPYAGLQSAKKRVREAVAPQSSFGPAKKPAKTGSGLKDAQVINSRAMKEGPGWYNSVDPKQAYARGDLQNLKFLFTLLDTAKKRAKAGGEISQSIFTIRQRIQAMEFYTFLSPILIKKSGLLGDEGLPQIFENHTEGVWFPWDIRADADILYRKWMSRQIDPHLFRGIVTRQGIIKSYSLDRDFDGRVSCNYIGVGNLVNGQWWPLQICAMRDGAHGELEAGIHGQKGIGAYSIVISGGGYANVDNGTSIEYCGTQGSEKSPSTGTSLMLKAYETQHPIRVLRSASLPPSNMYRPARGLRYDGIYRIISHETLDVRTAMYRFSLMRFEDQDPIRYSGEGKIPSDAQIIELNKIREQIG